MKIIIYKGNEKYHTIETDDVNKLMEELKKYIDIPLRYSYKESESFKAAIWDHDSDLRIGYFITEGELLEENANIKNVAYLLKEMYNNQHKEVSNSCSQYKLKVKYNQYNIPPKELPDIKIRYYESSASPDLANCTLGEYDGQLNITLIKKNLPKFVKENKNLQLAYAAIGYRLVEIYNKILEEKLTSNEPLDEGSSFLSILHDDRIISELKAECTIYQIENNLE